MATVRKNLDLFWFEQFKDLAEKYNELHARYLEAKNALSVYSFEHHAELESDRAEYWQLLYDFYRDEVSGEELKAEVHRILGGIDGKEQPETTGEV